MRGGERECAGYEPTHTLCMGDILYTLLQEELKIKEVTVAELELHKNTYASV